MRVRESCYVKMTQKMNAWRGLMKYHISVFFFHKISDCKSAENPPWINMSTTWQWTTYFTESMTSWSVDQIRRANQTIRPHNTGLLCGDSWKTSSIKRKSELFRKWGIALQLQQHRLPPSILEEGKYYLVVCKQEVSPTLSEIIKNVLSPFHAHGRIKNLTEFRHYLQ
jgi:hypothetical protein